MTKRVDPRTIFALLARRTPTLEARRWWAQREADAAARVYGMPSAPVEPVLNANCADLVEKFRVMRVAPGTHGGRRRGPAPIGSPPPVVILAIPGDMAEDMGMESALEALLRVPVPGWTWRADESAEAQASLQASARTAGVGVRPMFGRGGYVATEYGYLVAVRFDRAQ